MDQRACNRNHRHTIDDWEGRIGIIAMPTDQIAADQ